MFSLDSRLSLGRNASPEREAPWRVLVVDPDPISRRDRMRDLAARGAEVVGMHAADNALRVCEALPFDAVVCEHMAGGDPDGPTLLATLARSQPRLRRVLITRTGVDLPEIVAIAAPGTIDELCCAILGLLN